MSGIEGWMEKTSVLIIGKYTEIECNIQRYQSHFVVTQVNNLEEIRQIRKAERFKIKGIAFKGHSRFDLRIIKQFPSLEIIANFGVGYDTISVLDAKKLGVVVTYTPDVLSDDVADLALALLFGVSRQLSLGLDWIKSGLWPIRGEMPLNKRVSGSTCGIVGLGRIGFEIATRLESFKVKIHYFSRKKKNVSRDWTYYDNPVDLAKSVETLFVSIIGGPATHGFISAEVLKALGPKGILVNISRGSTIDEKALLDALEKKRIFGAGLDVFENEPNINPRFLQLGNVFMQPHQGSGTREPRQAMGDLQFHNILHYLRSGKALTLVPEMQ